VTPLVVVQPHHDRVKETKVETAEPESQLMGLAMTGSRILFQNKTDISSIR